MNPIITPVPMPIHHSSDPDRCPNCGKPENIIEVCKHCGHMYEEEPISGKDAFIGLCIVVSVILLAIYVTYTIIMWAGDASLGNESHLTDVFREQWEFLKRLKW